MTTKFTYQDFKKEYKSFKGAPNMAMFVLFEPVFFAWEDAIPCYNVTDKVDNDSFDKFREVKRIYCVNGNLVEARLNYDLGNNCGTGIEFISDSKAGRTKKKSKIIETEVIRGFRNFFRRDLGYHTMMQMGKDAISKKVEYDSKSESFSHEGLLYADNLGELALTFYFGKDEAKKITERVEWMKTEEVLRVMSHP